jgi:hypothetical protein
MTKFIMFLGAAALLVAAELPAPASAASRSTPAISHSTVTDISSQRRRVVRIAPRYRPVYRRAYAPRYYAPAYSYGYAPYYAPRYYAPPPVFPFFPFLWGW